MVIAAERSLPGYLIHRQDSAPVGSWCESNPARLHSMGRYSLRGVNPFPLSITIPRRSFPAFKYPPAVYRFGNALTNTLDDLRSTRWQFGGSVRTHPLLNVFYVDLMKYSVSDLWCNQKEAKVIYFFKLIHWNFVEIVPIMTLCAFGCWLNPLDWTHETGLTSPPPTNRTLEVLLNS